MLTKLTPEFTFAGFTFPRYIPELRRSNFDKRTSRSIYYHAPKPLTGKHPGKGFYLDSDGSPNRWEWADEIDGARINHTGWFCDEYRDEKIRGIVVRLPHGKLLAGWSMGEGMASEVDGTLYTDEIEAARAADSEAEAAAEREREYQEQERERQEQEEAEAERAEAELERNRGADEEESEGY